jgi:hypothetical protein
VAPGARGEAGFPQIHPDFVGIHLRALKGARPGFVFDYAVAGGGAWGVMTAGYCGAAGTGA